ncbi:MAG: hypothetical protein ACRDTV_09180, partial [Mycobacterium sp.]
MTDISRFNVATTARFGVAAALVGAAVAAAAVATLVIGPAGATQAAPDVPAPRVDARMHGDPAAAAPYWRYQQQNFDCGEMAVADVVGQVTGHEPSERAIIRVAQTTPSTEHSGSIYIEPSDKKNPNSGQGTDPADLPALLAHYGVKAVITDQQAAAQTGVPTG